MNRLLLSPAETAVALGVSRSMIYKLMAAGELETVKVGRARRIPVEAVEAYVEQLRSGQRARRVPA